MLSSVWAFRRRVQQRDEFRLGQDADAEFPGGLELAAGVRTGYEVVGLFADAGDDAAALRFGATLRLVARERLQTAREDEAPTFKLSAGAAGRRRNGEPKLQQPRDDCPVLGRPEKGNEAGWDL